MSKSNRKMKVTNSTIALILMNSILLIGLDRVEARDKGDDIIMTKGKLILRGGRGKGNLILDTGSKSSPMMPMMHFNPFQFYPMHQEQHHAPMMIRPIYIEDHSAMHQHHQHQPQEQHQQEQPEYHHEYQHEEPQQMHHEVEYHHEQPEHHEAYHHEEEHHGGYETNPMMSMMMHGSGLQPTYQQLAAMQALRQHQMQAFNEPVANDQPLASDQQAVSPQKDQEAASSTKPHSFVSMIKPLFKRHKPAGETKKP